MIAEEKSAGMGFGTSIVCSNFICKVNSIKPPMFGNFTAMIYDLSQYGTYNILPKKNDVVCAVALETKNKTEASMRHNEICNRINELGEEGKNLLEILQIMNFR